LAALAVAAWPTDLEACSCARVTTFDEAVQAAPVVVIGRVVGTKSLGASWVTAYLDLEVETSFKGSLAKGDVIRAWDANHRTPCSVDLRVHQKEGYVAVALHPSTAEVRRIWNGKDTKEPLREQDFLVHGCGQFHKPVSTADLDRVSAEIRDVLAARPSASASVAPAGRSRRAARRRVD
jgi:hypothetical protein